MDQASPDDYLAEKQRKKKLQIGKAAFKRAVNRLQDSKSQELCTSCRDIQPAWIVCDASVISEPLDVLCQNCWQSAEMKELFAKARELHGKCPICYENNLLDQPVPFEPPYEPIQPAGDLISNAEAEYGVSLDTSLHFAERENARLVEAGDPGGVPEPEDPAQLTFGASPAPPCPASVRLTFKSSHGSLQTAWWQGERSSLTRFIREKPPALASPTSRKRLVRKDVLRTRIANIITERITADETDEGKGYPRIPFPEFLTEREHMSMGTSALHDDHMRSLASAVERYSTEDCRIALFGRLCGLTGVPYYSSLTMDLVLWIYPRVIRAPHIVPYAGRQIPFILLSDAVRVVRELFATHPVWNFDHVKTDKEYEHLTAPWSEYYRRHLSREVYSLTKTVKDIIDPEHPHLHISLRQGDDTKIVNIDEFLTVLINAWEDQFLKLRDEKRVFRKYWELKHLRIFLSAKRFRILKPFILPVPTPEQVTPVFTKRETDLLWKGVRDLGFDPTSFDLGTLKSEDLFDLDFDTILANYKWNVPRTTAHLRYLWIKEWVVAREEELKRLTWVDWTWNPEWEYGGVGLQLDSSNVRRSDPLSLEGDLGERVRNTWALTEVNTDGLLEKLGALIASLPSGAGDGGKSADLLGALRRRQAAEAAPDPFPGTAVESYVPPPVVPVPPSVATGLPLRFPAAPSRTPSLRRHRLESSVLNLDSIDSLSLTSPIARSLAAVREELADGSEQARASPVALATTRGSHVPPHPHSSPLIGNRSHDTSACFPPDAPKRKSLYYPLQSPMRLPPPQPGQPVPLSSRRWTGGDSAFFPDTSRSGLSAESPTPRFDRGASSGRSLLSRTRSESTLRLGLPSGTQLQPLSPASGTFGLSSPGVPPSTQAWLPGSPASGAGTSRGGNSLGPAALGAARVAGGDTLPSHKPPHDIGTRYIATVLRGSPGKPLSATSSHAVLRFEKFDRVSPSPHDPASTFGRAASLPLPSLPSDRPAHPPQAPVMLSSSSPFFMFLCGTTKSERRAAPAPSGAVNLELARSLLRSRDGSKPGTAMGMSLGSSGIIGSSTRQKRLSATTAFSADHPSYGPVPSSVPGGPRREGERDRPLSGGIGKPSTGMLAGHDTPDPGRGVSLSYYSLSDDAISAAVGAIPEVEAKREAYTKSTEARRAGTSLAVKETKASKSAARASRYASLQAAKLEAEAVSAAATTATTTTTTTRPSATEGTGAQTSSSPQPLDPSSSSVEQLDDSDSEVDVAEFVVPDPGDVTEKVAPLTHISLAGNQIGPTACAKLFASVEKLAYLRVIDLSSNKIGPTGVASIGTFVREGRLRLRELLLEDNNIGDSGITALVNDICRSRSMPTLEVFDIAKNNLRQVIGPAKLLAKCPALKKLDLSWNSLSPFAGIELAKALGGNTSLLELRLQFNSLDDAAGAALFRACTSSKSSTTRRPGSNVAKRGRRRGPVKGRSSRDNPSEIPIPKAPPTPAQVGARVFPVGSAGGGCQLQCIDLSYNRLGPDSGHAALQALKSWLTSPPKVDAGVVSSYVAKHGFGHTCADVLIELTSKVSGGGRRGSGSSSDDDSGVKRTGPRDVVVEGAKALEALRDPHGYHCITGLRQVYLSGNAIPGSYMQRMVEAGNKVQAEIKECLLEIARLLDVEYESYARGVREAQEAKLAEWQAACEEHRSKRREEKAQDEALHEKRLTMYEDVYGDDAVAEMEAKFGAHKVIDIDEGLPEREFDWDPSVEKAVVEQQLELRQMATEMILDRVESILVVSEACDDSVMRSPVARDWWAEGEDWYAAQRKKYGMT